VDNKGNKQWVWLALDANTREIVGVYIGPRDEAAARKLWESLPPVYCGAGDAPPPVNVQLLTPIFGQQRQQFYQASGIVRSAKRRARPATLSDSTTRVRLRVSRLGRKTLSNSYVVGKSHWCHLVFCALLQCIITCLALPGGC